MESKLQENGAACTREEIQDIFSKADKDGSGMLNIREFRTSYKAVNMVRDAESSQGSQSPAQKRWSYLLYFTQNSGTIKCMMLSC